jgi:hypothetical protein
VTGRAAARLAALGMLAVMAVACSSSPSATGSGTSPVLPPAQVVSGATGSWATVVMGHLDDPLNTFGELLYRPGGPDCPGLVPCAPRAWAVATPAGVASNGGLFATLATGGTLTVGFGVSLDLTFSPLAETADQGATWSTGVLSAGLVPVTDALAASGAQGAPARLALVSTGGGQVLSSSGDLSTWAVMARRTTVSSAAAASGCDAGPLTAVAIAPSGVDLVATTCGSSSRAGIFRVGSGRIAGAVSPVGPVLPGPGSAQVRVERLVTTPAGVTALVVAGSGRSRRLYLATSHDDTATWTVSAPFATSGAVVASSVDPTGGMVVVLDTDGHRTAATVAPGAPWTTLPGLPAGTSIVARGPGAVFSALIPSGSTVTVDVLSGGSWTRNQLLAVPIQYGSTAAGGGGLA